MRHRYSTIKNQKGLTLFSWIGILAIIAGIGVGVYWWFMKIPVEPMPQMQTTEGNIETPPTVQASKEEMNSHSEGVMVSPQKQQLIGVKTEPAQVREITHTIRTVGQVEVDERRLIHMHTKLEGWIQELYVKFTGEKASPYFR